MDGISKTSKTTNITQVPIALTDKQSMLIAIIMANNGSLIFNSQHAARLIGESERNMVELRRKGVGPKYVESGNRTIKYTALEIVDYMLNKHNQSTPRH